MIFIVRLAIALYFVCLLSDITNLNNLLHVVVLCLHSPSPPGNQDKQYRTPACVTLSLFSLFCFYQIILWITKNKKWTNRFACVDGGLRLRTVAFCVSFFFVSLHVIISLLYFLPCLFSFAVSFLVPVLHSAPSVTRDTL